MAKQPNDYMLVELKEILREKKLSTAGNKAELVSRLINCDPAIWTMLGEARQQHNPEGTNEGHERGKASGRKLFDPARERTAETRAGSSSTRDRNCKRICVRRPMDGSGGQHCDPPSENVRVLHDLLSEFDDSEGTF